MNRGNSVKSLGSPPSSSSSLPTTSSIRLADYFAVVGYSTDHQRGVGCGVILQRFPTKDWNDAPFIPEIELFCQPQGWALSTEIQEPTFLVCTLTDMMGDRRYCACLSFHEPISVSPTKPVDEVEESTAVCTSDSFLRLSTNSGSIRRSVMYAPKCLVLMSRLYQIEAFRHCLGTLYTVHTEGLQVSLETLIGNLLGHIMVPPPGGPQIRYSIGGGDRQALQPPLSASIPVTGSTVATLFQQLGINNGLILFCAVLTEQKILFHSKSFSRLTEASHALASLMFPFRYSHVYVPLLPSSITEVVSSPTPFIIGIHSDARYDVTETMDVIMVDLDGGSILIPEGLSIPKLPNSLWTKAQELLSLVLHPELTSADYAFPPLVVKPSVLTHLDKEIRAILMRILAQLLQGYRSCLVIIRIHPKPVITFHKAKFLGQRGLCDNEFVVRLLDCMFFNQFIAERGTPWRPNDIWDDLYRSFSETLKAEANDPKLTMNNIQELAQLLSQNESPNLQTYVPKIVKPPEGAFSRIHKPMFPSLSATVIQEIIDEGASKCQIQSYNITKVNQPRVVPIGPKVTELLEERQHLVDNSARRLEVLRNCINCIFENKISDARKSIHAVIRSLKSQTAKLVFCQELSQHVTGNKAMLEAQQFDLVVKLMHCALQDISGMDEHGVAAALLPLSTSFCRKLCTGVIQYAYSSIQEHPVWKNQQFWESAFYCDVQKDIKALYLPRAENSFFNNNYSAISSYDGNKQGHGTTFKRSDYSALEIAAEQIRLGSAHDLEKSKELIGSEESTVYSQAIHYANRMVYLLVPMDTPCRKHKDTNSHHHTVDEEKGSNFTSVNESDSAGAESGFEEQDPMVGDSGTSVAKFVSRFVDKVCAEGGVTEDHIRSLHTMIPGIVDMHLETLEVLNRESRRLPPIPKPKIPAPALLPGEEQVIDSLRVFLLRDGRETESVLLPAEGALFFTNYRLIFKGSPCDPSASEQIVIRSFPLSSLTKEKRVTVQCGAPLHLDQLIQEGFQLRSATFQMMRLVFDEEVSSENVEIFRKMLSKLRHPTDIFAYFAFAGGSVCDPAPLSTTKDKKSTLRIFAKKTLMSTAKKVGLKPKPSKRQKYVLRSWAQGNGGTLPASTKYMTGNSSMISQKQNQIPKEVLDGDDGSISEDDFPHPTLTKTLCSPTSESKNNLELIMDRRYYKDWKRLGLCGLTRATGPANTNVVSILNKADQFRACFANTNYGITSTYPALVIIPNSVSDDSVRKLSKYYQNSRFPVVTWRHPRTRGLLVRASSFDSKGVMGLIIGQTGTGAGSDSSLHLEQENYLRALVNRTPLPFLRAPETLSPWSLGETNLRMDSILTSSVKSNRGSLILDSPLASINTPEIVRKAGNPFAKAMDTLRYGGTSGGKGMRTYKSWTTTRPNKSISSNPAATFKSSSKLVDRETVTEGLTRHHSATVYVFGEKSQIKGMKTDLHTKVEYIPVDFVKVRHSRAAFKKLMRACIPSNDPTDPENGYLKTTNNTDWLQQLSGLMQLSGAIVDLIDIQGSSVMLCLEDGSDATCLIASVSELCLDPYYRTFEGFQTLIEKEWLAFGHRFSRRNNMTGHEGPSSNPGFAPVFLQFLDIIHQIHAQFPMAFEFNQYYLKFIAYHSVSARFRTFLVDNEYERVLYGFMAMDDKRGSLPRHYKGVDKGSDDESLYMAKPVGSNGHQHNLGQSLFEYIEKVHARTPIFFNFKFEKNSKIQVLRPVSCLANLEVWDYYVNENLGTGASFDFEVTFFDHIPDDEPNSDGVKEKDPRKCISSGYDILESHIPDSFKYILSEIYRLETDVGHLPQKWKQMWDKLEEPLSSEESPVQTRSECLTTQMVRSLGRSLHKKSTIDILVKGKMFRSSTAEGTNQGKKH